MFVLYLLIRRAPIATRSDPLFPFPPLFRSRGSAWYGLSERAAIDAVAGGGDILYQGNSPAAVTLTSDNRNTDFRIGLFVPPQPAVNAQIGRAHVRTPVTNAQIVCSLMSEKKNNYYTTYQSKRWKTKRQ